MSGRSFGVVDMTVSRLMRTGRLAKGMPVLAGVALALLLLVACEAPGIPHPLAAQAANPANSALAPVPAPAPPPELEPEPTQVQQIAEPASVPSTAQVSLKDFHLDPNVVTVKAGTITFVLKNEGRYTHDFRVVGQGIDDKAPKVGRGREREWQVALTPGTYRISCPISNHADRGMTGTLTVVE